MTGFAFECTLNAHQLLHIKHTVNNYDPLYCNHNFVYESKGGELSSLIKSSYAANEQVANQNGLLFNLNLAKEENSNEELIPMSSYRSRNAEYFKKVKYNKKTYTTWPYGLDKKTKNCIVRLKNKEDFFIIQSFYYENDNLFFNCLRLKKKKFSPFF